MIGETLKKDVEIAKLTSTTAAEVDNLRAQRDDLQRTPMTEYDEIVNAMDLNELLAFNQKLHGEITSLFTNLLDSPSEYSIFDKYPIEPGNDARFVRGLNIPELGIINIHVASEPDNEDKTYSLTVGDPAFPIEMGTIMTFRTGKHDASNTWSDEAKGLLAKRDKLIALCEDAGIPIAYGLEDNQSS